MSAIEEGGRPHMWRQHRGRVHCERRILKLWGIVHGMYPR